MKGSVGILSLGCPRNLVDSENLLSRLNLKGYKIVDMEKAEIGIVNTCAFIKDAKVESIDAILDLSELKKSGSLKKIIVCGCLVQRYKDEIIKEFPEVDVFIGRMPLGQNKDRYSLTPRHYAYLKICEGCLNKCSFCVIPRIKGRFTSRSIESLVSEAADLDKKGVKELNIIGQDISGYGIDLYGKHVLPKLLKEILTKTHRIDWIRLLYLYPSRLTDELLRLVRDQERICKYIDLPLQHINDRILRLMNRGMTKKGILELIEKIRKLVPEAAIRTSFIVGFPSESEEEFRELMDFVEEAEFERLGAFIYSREEGSPAYGYHGQKTETVKKERFNALMMKQQEISGKINSRLLGKEMDVIIDEKDKQGYSGRTQFDAPEVDGMVYVHSGTKLEQGDIIKVRITDTLEYDLVGEAIK
ncbi:MAG: 30S ribosomal protein S12 methylthiotransferase RimO [Candidatus Omnitrophota bacterium]|jgi:ribosomal protein S12 methylthiotransferase|nr:MAG: 30S ribosomal protein S12 methylthiotransferase RimO [Candidatus Omnitrophota bacterium]